VLETPAQRVRERLRASDILCCWGGEEFMVLLPETGLT
jgi:GGDEF domain-containing protein